jgi:hypothetical protein
VTCEYIRQDTLTESYRDMLFLMCTRS